MTSSRRAWAVALALVSWSAVRASAQELVDGVAVLALGTPTTDHASQRPGTPTVALAALREVVPGTVVVSDLPGATDSLMDDLRLLPRRLTELADRQPGALAQRMVVCYRQAQGSAELALVDLEEQKLLDYRQAALPQPAALTDLVCGMVRQARPREGALLAEFTTETGRAVSTHPEPQATGTVMVARDAPDEARFQTAPLRFAAARPHPLPAAAPDEPAIAPVAMDAILRQFAGQSLAWGGLGQARNRPQVVETSYELLLLPLRDPDPAAPPVRTVVTVYSIGAETRIEYQFSRPVKLSLPGQQGSWAAADLVGYQVEADSVVDIDRSGLLNIHFKPTASGTRIGFQLTGAGEVDLEGTRDGKILLATVRKSEARAREREAEAEALPGASLPWDGYQVVRTQRGQSSWYGGAFHGRRTANGERYNQWGYTAAHRTLPLGSWIRVTNLRNGRQCILRVNDRGPYAHGRILDCSAAAAQALGFYGAGVATVQVEALRSAR